MNGTTNPELDRNTPSAAASANPAGRANENKTMSVWKVITSFEGRVNRNIFLSVIPLLVLAWWMAVAIPVNDLGPVGQTAKLLALVAWVVVGTYIQLAVSAKRLHDMGRSGWFSVLTLGGVGLLPMLVWMAVAKGTAGPNRYGPQPMVGDSWRWAVKCRAGSAASLPASVPKRSSETQEALPTASQGG